MFSTSSKISLILKLCISFLLAGSTTSEAQGSSIHAAIVDFTDNIDRISPFPKRDEPNDLHTIDRISNATGGGVYRDYNRELSKLYNTLDDTGPFKFCAYDWGCNFVRRAAGLRTILEEQKEGTISEYQDQFANAKIGIDNDLKSLEEGQGYSSNFSKNYIVENIDDPSFKAAKDIESQIGDIEIDFADRANNVNNSKGSIPLGPVSVNPDDVKDLANNEVPEYSNGRLKYNSLGYGGNNLDTLRGKANFYESYGRTQMANRMRSVAKRYESSVVNGGVLPVIELNVDAARLLGKNKDVDSTKFTGHETAQLANGFSVLPDAVKTREMQLGFGILLDKLSYYASQADRDNLSDVLSAVEVGWSIVTTLIDDPIAAIGIGQGYEVAKEGFEEGVYQLFTNPKSILEGIVLAVINHEEVWITARDTIIENMDTVANCEDQPHRCGEIAGALKFEIQLAILSGAAGEALQAGKLAQYAFKLAANKTIDKFADLASKAIKIDLTPDQFDDLMDYGTWNIPAGSPMGPDAVATADKLLEYAKNRSLTGSTAIREIKEGVEAALDAGLGSSEGIKTLVETSEELVEYGHNGKIKTLLELTEGWQKGDSYHSVRHVVAGDITNGGTGAKRKLSGGLHTPLGLKNFLKIRTDIQAETITTFSNGVRTVKLPRDAYNSKGWNGVKNLEVPGSKTLFPETWNMRKVIEATNDTLANGRQVGSNKWEHVYDNVRVTVIKRDGKVITAYPSKVQ